MKENPEVGIRAQPELIFEIVRKTLSYPSFEKYSGAEKKTSL